MQARRFEIVPDDLGCHARFWSGGNIIWWTESYRNKASAEHAIALMRAYAPTVPLYDLTT